MNYIQLLLILAFSTSVVFAPPIYQLEAGEVGNPNPQLVDLFRKADQLLALVRAVIDNKEVEHNSLSLEQLTETIKNLESYREKMIVRKNKSEAEARCLSLAQELVRQLTNARLAYQQKMKNKESVQKVVISAGTAVAVVGGLLVLKAAGAFDINVSTAVACGIAAGCVVGAVTYYQKH